MQPGSRLFPRPALRRRGARRRDAGAASRASPRADGSNARTRRDRRSGERSLRDRAARQHERKRPQTHRTWRQFCIGSAAGKSAVAGPTRRRSHRAYSGRHRPTGPHPQRHRMSVTPYLPRREARSRFVEARGLRHHVLEWGDTSSIAADRPPLVLLHGWMDVGASFQFIVDALSVERHVLALDWRGFGARDTSAADTYFFPDYLG